MQVMLGQTVGFTVGPAVVVVVVEDPAVKKGWNLFHAPSSGKAMARFSTSWRELSLRISRGIAERSLKGIHDHTEYNNTHY